MDVVVVFGMVENLIEKPESSPHTSYGKRRKSRQEFIFVRSFVRSFVKSPEKSKNTREKGPKIGIFSFVHILKS